jgi:hypothetical protein
MSLYRKYAQGPAVKGEFTLSAENIESYHKMAMQMDKELRWMKTLTNLLSKKEHPEQNTDSLYTPEYIDQRIKKLLSQNYYQTETAHVEQYIAKLKELEEVEKELEIVRPLVFDKEEGKKPENHERMSVLNDKWKQLLEEKNNIFGDKYPDLKNNLPKIYYMILEDVDMDTLNSCFLKMKAVLLDRLTPEEAANKLMDESQSKYNLPKTIYDPIRSNRRTGKTRPK